MITAFSLQWIASKEASVRNDLHDLGLMLDSKNRLIVIESWDEVRVLEVLQGLALQRGISLFTWSVTEGLAGLAGREEDETRDPEKALRMVKADPRPNLYVFCDLHPFLDSNVKVVRLLKEVAMHTGESAPVLVLVSHALKLPAEVQRLGVRFALSFPGEEELLRIVHEEANRWSDAHRGSTVQADREALDKLIKNLRGLSHAEVRMLARKLIWNDGAINAQDLGILNRSKFQLLDFEGVLRLEEETRSFEEVGGLARLKEWLRIRRPAFMEGAQAGDIPKGILLAGVQGGGKSLCAKSVSEQWGLPLLRLDFACLYNKFFGETERNLREALALADRMAPCVLWIDEIEKGLARGMQDDGVSQRVLGTLLTWMAERRKAVFLVATANEIDSLPPELLRKGRFDELFFIDLPSAEVRSEIFKIHLRRRELEVESFDLPTLVAASEGFSGAEIEQAIVSALYHCQARQQPVDSPAVLEALMSTVPLSVLMSERLTALRSWAQGRTVKAD